MTRETMSRAATRRSYDQGNHDSGSHQDCSSVGQPVQLKVRLPPPPLKPETGRSERPQGGPRKAMARGPQVGDAGVCSGVTGGAGSP